ncbi:transcriptional regulator [Thermoleophilia bacterium SCSIO 60948]|nr:transcriptional regulator [Thermoleophilia bacterium SCSIO 60948]
MIGRRWTGAILWALIDRPLYFSELSSSVPGLSDRLLSARLRQLESEGLIERSVEAGSRPRVRYSLSEKGSELEPCMRELADWARRWNEV